MEDQPQFTIENSENLEHRNLLYQTIRQRILATTKPITPEREAQLRDTIRRSNRIITLIQNYGRNKTHVDTATEVLFGLGVIDDAADRPILRDYLAREDVSFSHNVHHPNKLYEYEAAALAGSELMTMGVLVRAEIEDFHGTTTTADRLAVVGSFLASLVSPEDLAKQQNPATDAMLEAAAGM
jgi:hypothetical protein